MFIYFVSGIKYFPLLSIHFSRFLGALLYSSIFHLIRLHSNGCVKTQLSSIIIITRGHDLRKLKKIFEIIWSERYNKKLKEFCNSWYSTIWCNIKSVFVKVRQQQKSHSGGFQEQVEYFTFKVDVSKTSKELLNE